MKPSAGLALIAFAASACNFYGGRCTYELRAFDGAGKGMLNGSEVASAQVSLSEQRGSIVGQSFSWLVTGTLKGNVTLASFKDASNPLNVLLDLPVLPVTRDPILEGAADSRNGAALAGFHDILVNGRGVIELQTDLPDASAVTIPITTVNAGDWIRPYCS